MKQNAKHQLEYPDCRRSPQKAKARRGRKDVPMKQIGSKFALAYLFFMALFTVLILCCKKKPTPTPKTTPTLTIPTAASDMKTITGLWSLHGTIDAPNYNGYYGFYTHDTAVATMTIFQANDTIIVTKIDGEAYYEVFVLVGINDSTITLKDVNIWTGITANIV